MRYTASFDFSDIDTDLPIKKWEVVNERKPGAYLATIYSDGLSFKFETDSYCNYTHTCNIRKDNFNKCLYFNHEESISYYYLADEKDIIKALKLIAELYDLYLEHRPMTNKSASN